jgi:hypothetical protein
LVPSASSPLPHGDQTDGPALAYLKVFTDLHVCSMPFIAGWPHLFFNVRIEDRPWWAGHAFVDGTKGKPHGQEPAT